MSTVLNVQPTHTAEELFEKPRSDRFELVAGELVPMSPPGGMRGSTSISISGIVLAHVLQHKLGTCFASETGFLLARNPDTVLAPDFAFVFSERCPLPIPDGYLELCPDLVLETRSPSDMPQEVLWKVKLWLSYGARLVWDLDPKQQQLTAYHASGAIQSFGIDDTVTCGDVLPELRFELRRVFPQG